MSELPKTYKRLIARQFTPNFRKAVTIETVSMCIPTDEEICVRNRFVGANAFDLNVSKGIPLFNDKVPFAVGLEAVGEVVQVGKAVKNIKIGDAVAYVAFKRNAYAEYSCIAANTAHKIPDPKPEYLVLVVSGLSSSIGLFENAKIKKGETVLITAAAGGLGHITVQLAKMTGCHVIGTCSTEEKENILKNLGCDRVINYKKEHLGDVLDTEYPKGIDVIWETIGGSVFETCVEKLAEKGRLLIVGGITGYKEENREVLPMTNFPKLLETIFFRSASVQGFCMLNYAEHMPSHFECLLEHLKRGKIKALCNFGKKKEFVGMEGIIEAVEYLYSGISLGKVIVKIP